MAKNRRGKKVTREIATCDFCGAEYPERDAAKEYEYTCVGCGRTGYDCCVPGNHALCVECEEQEA
jgi:hypothetical protein